MHRQLYKLTMYRDRYAELLRELAGITDSFARGDYQREQLTDRVNGVINSLLSLATRHNFNGNLWNCYLAYILAFSENPFSVSLERREFTAGSVSGFMLEDMAVFIELRDYDFSALENALCIKSFSVIKNYNAVKKERGNYSEIISRAVYELAIGLVAAEDKHALFSVVADFYRQYGVGFFGLNKAFRLTGQADSRYNFSNDSGAGGFSADVKGCLMPITSPSAITFDMLVGIERQIEHLKHNTAAFLQGLPANNCLLYGDSGTGKSSSIKALLNLYYGEGLRMIEVYKHEFYMLSRIIDTVKNRNYKFIIFMDDLSFEPDEIDYKYLKAVIEGGPGAMPSNVLIYATSNRRHFVRELWSDRDDMSSSELHRSDTLEEKLSLAARFGLSLNFSRPDRDKYIETVLVLASQAGLDSVYNKEELKKRAIKWELSGAGFSGRSAAQFVRSLLAEKGIEQ